MFRSLGLLSLGLLLAWSIERPALAQGAGVGSIDEAALSIEAPAVQRILRRAALLERSSPDGIDLEFVASLYCYAARLGSLEAQYRLGEMVREGRGMKQDAETAAALFSIAAGNGHAGASLALEHAGVQDWSLPACLSLPLAATRQTQTTQ